MWQFKNFTGQRKKIHESVDPRTLMVGAISYPIIRFWEAAKILRFSYSPRWKNCLATCNLEDEIGTFDVLLLDTDTKGSSNKTEHMLYNSVSALSIRSRPRRSSKIKLANSSCSEKDSPPVKKILQMSNDWIHHHHGANIPDLLVSKETSKWEDENFNWSDFSTYQQPIRPN